MAQEKPQNLQDTFLNHVRKTKVPVTVFLVNGVKLQGIITWFDNFCLLLRRDGVSQLVYKHAISTIMPGGPISLFDDEGAVTVTGPARTVFDVTGAGDTVIATLAVCAAAGMSWREALPYANKAGGEAVGQFGTATVSFEEVFGL